MTLLTDAISRLLESFALLTTTRTVFELVFSVSLAQTLSGGGSLSRLLRSMP